jgi:hypothetical protein
VSLTISSVSISSTPDRPPEKAVETMLKDVRATVERRDAPRQGPTPTAARDYEERMTPLAATGGA